MTSFAGPPPNRPSYAAPPPPPRTPPRAQHSGEWEGGEWTGSHRAITTGRRGISVGVIGALVAVVVVVAAFILWRFFGDALSDRSSVASARCVDGQEAVAVVADPSISDQISTLGKKFNETANPVGDRCVAIDVKPAESDQVINGFIGNWPPELGERPALWIPGSSVSQARLEAVAGAQTVSDSRSLVSSPVMLAIRPQLKDALAQQNWGTLPSLQSNPNSLNGLGLPGWGSLRLALPLSGDSDASYLAAEAVAAASAPAGAAPSAGTGAVNTLVSGQPKLADNKATTAMDALLNSNDPAAAPVHAVVTTEQQLYQRGTSLPDAKNVGGLLASARSDRDGGLSDGSAERNLAVGGTGDRRQRVRPIPARARTTRRAGQARFPHRWRQDAAERRHQLRAGFGAAVGRRHRDARHAGQLAGRTGGQPGRHDHARPVDARAGGRQDPDGECRRHADPSDQALPSNSAVGLWTFDGVEGRSEVSIGPLSQPVDGQQRSAALTETLDALSSSSSGAVSFTTLRLVYTEAMTNFRQGQTNSILVITTGPHTDQTLDGSGLQAFIREAFDAAKPVAVNVIDFGSDSDRATWEAVAQTTGGSYQNLSSSASPELTSAITRFLG